MGQVTPGQRDRTDQAISAPSLPSPYSRAMGPLVKRNWEKHTFAVFKQFGPNCDPHAATASA